MASGAFEVFDSIAVLVREWHKSISIAESNRRYLGS